MNRLILNILVLSIALVGCATQPKPSQLSDPEHFITIAPEQGHSLSDIANQYLGDRNLSFRISEFNNINKPELNKLLIIPLKKLYPYGIKKTGYQTIPVLSYHAFSWKTSNSLTVREDDFEAQMSYLKENGYHVVSIHQLIDFFNGNELPDKAVLITIDDGWGSAYRIAYPILRKYGYPYTLFIQTDLINSAYKTLDWDQIREMQKNSNLSIGSHSKTHRDLSKPKSRESFKKYIFSIKQELKQSKEIILQETGVDPVYFAYPYGATNQFVIDLMKDTGYSAGFTIIREPNSILTNPMKLSRSMIYGTYTLEAFKDQLQTFEHYDFKTKQRTPEIGAIQPSESFAQQLEDKGHWLQALNHWRLIRDSLVEKVNNENNLRNNQKPIIPGGLFQYFKNPYLEEIATAEHKIEQLEAQVQAIANEHYEKGIDNFSKNEILQGVREMLKALYFNPELEKAKSRLSQQTTKPEYHRVEVKTGDTHQSIAKKIYKNASMFSLVSHCADKQGGLAPGIELKLPVLPEEIVQPPKPKRQIIIEKPKDNCGIKPVPNKKESAKKYFYLGEKYFKKSLYYKAIKALETSICLDPKNNAAAELLKLLKSIVN